MNIIARDLKTENAELREELKRAQMELRRLDEMKRSFIALAAHELRNPLAILLGYAKLLSGCEESDVQAYASIIVGHAWQLKNTVDAIITLQQVDAGELTLRREATSLADAVQHIIDSRQNEIREKELTVLTILGPHLHVYADRERLALILTQLFANSIKYSPTGGTITIEAQAQPSSIVVSVRDVGIGIPPEEQPHIFDRFYQGANPLTRQYNGMGLGLAVAKALVELHDGKIWLESASHQGTAFYFSLPRVFPSDEIALSALAKHRVKMTA